VKGAFSFHRSERIISRSDLLWMPSLTLRKDPLLLELWGFFVILLFYTRSRASPSSKYSVPSIFYPNSHVSRTLAENTPITLLCLPKPCQSLRLLQPLRLVVGLFHVFAVFVARSRRTHKELVITCKATVIAVTSATKGISVSICPPSLTCPLNDSFAPSSVTLLFEIPLL